MLACSFDMCALEGDPLQEVYRCGIYESFTSVCNNLLSAAGKTDMIQWRTPTNCRK